MRPNETYQDFLNSKIKLAEKKGFEFPEEAHHAILKPHQRDIVAWAIRGGCRAIFASFGLGKTLIQIEILKAIAIREAKPVLIVCPLGVKHEFIRDGRKVQIDIRYITSTDQLDEHKFYITNYERIRMGSIDPSLFAGVSFDEASILRSLETDTTEMIMKTFMAIPYRFVCTATPSPNRFLELINYAEYLGIMDRGQSLTRFFQRDSTTAGNLTLYEKRKKEFWYWMSSWACFITKPSDLGYDNAGYDLPEIIIHRHMVQYDRDDIVDKKTNQMTFVANASKSLVDAAKEKRESLVHRVEKIEEILLSYKDDRREKAVSESLLRSQQAEAFGEATRTRAKELSEEQSGLYREEQKVEGGESGTNEGASIEASEISKMEGVSTEALSVQHGEKQNYESSQQVEARVWIDSRRVQSDVDRSEPLLQDLSEKTKEESSGGSLSQNGKSSRSSLPSLQRSVRPIPGRRDGTNASDSVSDQFIIWCNLNTEQDEIERILSRNNISFVSLRGSENSEARETKIEQWKDCKVSVFLSKPEMYGLGLNMQQANKMIFAGITYKFEEFIQAIHRIYRYGQENVCEIHIIYTDAEDDILKTLEVKWANHLILQNEMTSIIQEHGLNSDLFKAELGREMFTTRKEFKSENYHAVNNDCVEEIKSIADNSMHLVCTSIPFGNHYEYSENYNCFGHNESNEDFFKQMDFLIPDLYRVLSPGRIAAIHVKDRIRYSYMNGTGFTSIDPFSDDTTRAFRKHGFHLLTRITVTTDVVQENNQTYRLGWSEKCKDGSKMGAGLPEYVLVFRKAPSSSDNAYADIPVEHDKKEYARARWQLDAHAFWKSAGERLTSLDELRKLDLSTVLELWKAFEAGNIYDYRKHVQICELLDIIGKLPSTFMTLPPQSNHPDVWDDVTRMNTLNSDQSRRNLTKHICPLQLDIIERLIESYTNKGETVLDPFAGIMSVPFQALKMDRKAVGIELNTSYWFDGLRYLRSVDIEKSQLTLI